MLPRMLLAALTLILTAAVWSISANAQQRPSGVSQERAAELQKKALKLLESLANQVTSLQSSQNRARIGSNIAGTLWKHDEPRARELLALVEQDIKAGLQPPEVIDKSAIHTLQVFLRLRSDTVLRISKQNAKAALAFYNATKPHFDEELGDDLLVDESVLELQLAEKVASQNPELAVEISRKLDITRDLLSILRRVRLKDKEQGRILHKEIVNKIKKLDSRDRMDAMSVAKELIYSFMPPEADDSTFRELVNVLITIAIESGCGEEPTDTESRSHCFLIGDVASLMEKFDPVRGAKLKRWIYAGEEEIAAFRGQLELAELTQTGNVDELLALATRFPQIARDVYDRAVAKAIDASDPERARKIAVELVADTEQKRAILERVAAAAESRALQEDQIATIEKDITSRPSLEKRTNLWLFVLFHAIETGTDRKFALTIASKAEDEIASMKFDKKQVELQIGLAVAYCMLNSERGFTIMESLIPKLNELVDAAVQLEGYDTNYVRENEWNMSAGGGIGETLTDVADNAGSFAWADFDRAVSLASQFQRNEIRIMAQLKLAQGILDGPKTYWLL